MNEFGGICPNRQLGSCRCVFWLREYGKFYGDPRKDGLAVPEIRAIVKKELYISLLLQVDLTIPLARFHVQGALQRVTQPAIDPAVFLRRLASSRSPPGFRWALEL